MSVLWSLSVDSRLVTAGKEPRSARRIDSRNSGRGTESSPPPQLKSVFEGLWQTSYFTHSELIEMAGDTLRVMDRAVQDVEGGEVRRLKIRSCSCRVSVPAVPVSTYSWVEDMGTKVEPYMLRTSSVRITQDGTWISEPVIGALSVQAACRRRHVKRTVKITAGLALFSPNCIE